MGTSDTIFSICPADDSRPGLEGHFFVNPVDPNSHMAMLCYKNGSLAREAVCEQVTGKRGDWKAFGALLDNTAPGNGGNLGFYIFQVRTAADPPPPALSSKAHHLTSTH
jgi:xylulokinase